MPQSEYEARTELDAMYHASGRLMALALRINTETNVAVFVNFSGHADLLEVEICESRHDYLNTVAKMNIRLDDTPLQNRDRIETVNQLLEEIVGFDTSDLNALRKLCDAHPATDDVY